MGEFVKDDHVEGSAVVNMHYRRNLSYTYLLDGRRRDERSSLRWTWCPCRHIAGELYSLKALHIDRSECYWPEVMQAGWGIFLGDRDHGDNLVTDGSSALSKSLKM